MKPGPWTIGCLLLSLAAAPAARAAPAAAAPATQPAPFELKDGDRVVFVGGTFMEREAQFGYIETMLTTRFPDRNVTFRNLGYAGDTVACEARRICQGWATFGGPDEGFNRLKALVQEIQPTVIVAAYGMGESFGGEAKLPEFVDKYNRLLDMLTTAGGVPAEQVRVVLLSPTYHENMGPPLPDPAEHNKNLEAYSAAIKGIAEKRGHRFVDLFTPSKAGNPWEGFTENGLHLDARGYWLAALAVADQLGFPRDSANVTIDKSGTVKVDGPVKITNAQPWADNRMSFTVDEPFLPTPVPPGSWKMAAAAGEGTQAITFSGLDVEHLTLTNGTDRVVAWRDAADMSFDLVLARNEPAEQLRRLIVTKNADFFNYWRPENDTYILGYRKGEQGRNAVELPQFKPLVEAKEKEIANLRKPKPVTWTLEPSQVGDHQRQKGGLRLTD